MQSFKLLCNMPCDKRQPTSFYKWENRGWAILNYMLKVPVTNVEFPFFVTILSLLFKMASFGGWHKAIWITGSLFLHKLFISGFLPLLTFEGSRDWNDIKENKLKIVSITSVNCWGSDMSLQIMYNVRSKSWIFTGKISTHHMYYTHEEWKSQKVLMWVSWVNTWFYQISHACVDSHVLFK